jgi:hypothetical protein
LAWLAVIVVGQTIPSSIQQEYWILQQRLMPHAACCYRWIENDVAKSYCLEQSEPGSADIATSFLCEKFIDGVRRLGSYTDQGKLAEAEEMYVRALGGFKKALGPEHTSTLETVISLGDLYHIQGKLAEVDKMLIRALEGFEKVLGPEHTLTLRAINNLGTLYRH